MIKTVQLYNIQENENIQINLGLLKDYKMLVKRKTHYIENL